MGNKAENQGEEEEKSIDQIKSWPTSSPPFSSKLLPFLFFGG